MNWQKIERNIIEEAKRQLKSDAGIALIIKTEEEFKGFGNTANFSLTLINVVNVIYLVYFSDVFEQVRLTLCLLVHLFPNSRAGKDDGVKKHEESMNSIIQLFPVNHCDLHLSLFLFK